MERFNLVNIAFILIFLIPIISGAMKAFTRDRIQRSFVSLLDGFEFLAGLLLSIYLTRKIFFDHNSGIFKTIYAWIPENVRSLLYEKDVLTYIIVVPILLFILLFMIRILTNPIYNKIVIPLSNRIYVRMNAIHDLFRRMIGALAQIPKAFFIIFVFGLILNFFTYYFYSPVLSKWMNESNAYQLLYKNAIYPVLNSNIAKQIPVIVNDSFGKTAKKILPGEKGNNLNGVAGKLIDQLSKGNIRVIEYFNGVTLDEAIRSNEEIDSLAVKIVGTEKNTKKKGYLLYKWISKNVKYDYVKAEKIGTDPRGISSGSIVAFTTRKGICFDYSSLYVSMCRAVGIKVRLITGLGYSGTFWGDHAWNQVYSIEEKRWINVDTTFGSVANYFDKSDFKVDHADAEIQGEW